MGLVEQGRAGLATTQTVIPALSRDPLSQGKSHGGIAHSSQRLGAAEKWAPAQGRGDERVESAHWERVAS